MPSMVKAPLVSSRSMTDKTATATPMARVRALRTTRTISAGVWAGPSSARLTCMRASTEVPRASARVGRELMSGQDRSRSHLETALSVTPIRSASSSWVIPFAFLSSAIIMPMVFFMWDPPFGFCAPMVAWPPQRGQPTGS